MTTSTPSAPVSTPGLTTGWEPDLREGDTVLRRFTLHFGEYFAAAATAMRGRVQRRPEVCLADHGRPTGFYNSAVLLQPPSPDGWDAVLRTVEDFFLNAGGHARGEVFLWSPWPTPDLTGRGWQLEGHPPLLVRPPGGRVPEPSPGLTIREVRDSEGVEDWVSVMVDGYPFAELQPYRAGTLFDGRLLEDQRWRLWVGYADDRPVSIGTLFTAHGFAQLAGGVTLPEARGQGFWYGLVRERLLAANDTISGSIFSDHSRPGAERLGYLPVSRFTCWHRARG